MEASRKREESALQGRQIVGPQGHIVRGQTVTMEGNKGVQDSIIVSIYVSTYQSDTPLKRGLSKQGVNIRTTTYIPTHLCLYGIENCFLPYHTV